MHVIVHKHLGCMVVRRVHVRDLWLQGAEWTQGPFWGGCDSHKDFWDIQDQIWLRIHHREDSKTKTGRSLFLPPPFSSLLWVKKAYETEWHSGTSQIAKEIKETCSHRDIHRYRSSSEATLQGSPRCCVPEAHGCAGTRTDPCEIFKDARWLVSYGFTGDPREHTFYSRVENHIYSLNSF